MSADQSLILLNSDNDVTPGPPAKRGRRGRGRPAAASRRRSSRGRSSQGGRPQRALPAVQSTRSTRGRRRRYGGNFIPVGDISSDEMPSESSDDETPEPLPPAPQPEQRMSIAALARILGVDDTTADAQDTLPESVINIGDNDVNEGIKESLASSSVVSLSSDKKTDLNNVESNPGQSVSPPETDSKLVEKDKETPDSNSTPKSVEADKSSIPNLSSNVPQDSGASSSTDIKPKAGVKKTRRGLAKKGAGLTAPVLDNPGETHDSAVYSKCVPTGGLIGLLNVNRPGQVLPTTPVRQHESSETPEIGVQSGADTKKAPERLPVSIIDEMDTSRDGTDLDVSLLNVRSPTPPPELPTQPRGRGKKKMTKKLSNALQVLSNVRGKLNPTTPTMFKQRGRRQQDVVCTGEEVGIEKTDITVKVRYLSTVHRISLNMDEPLYTLTNRLCHMVGDVQQHSLALMLRDQPLDLSKTARSIKLTVADIVDCHEIRPLQEGCESGSDESIKVVVQCQHSRTKATISTHKRRPLRELVEKFAENNGLDPGSLSLTFDGEDVDLDDSPLQLDMDDLDMVDVFVR